MMQTLIGADTVLATVGGSFKVSGYSDGTVVVVEGNAKESPLLDGTLILATGPKLTFKKPCILDVETPEPPGGWESVTGWKLTLRQAYPLAGGTESLSGNADIYAETTGVAKTATYGTVSEKVAARVRADGMRPTVNELAEMRDRNWLDKCARRCCLKPGHEGEHWFLPDVPIASKDRCEARTEVKPAVTVERDLAPQHCSLRRGHVGEHQWLDNPPGVLGYDDAMPLQCDATRMG